MPPPQDQHIDPGISAHRVAALRGMASGALIAAVPKARLRGHGRLPVRDDLVGDFGVKARVVVAGTKS